MKKIQLQILSLTESVPLSNSFTVVLGEVGGKRRLPVVIGSYEAQAIAIKLENMQTYRPLTHDLFKNFADHFDIHLTEVRISDLKEGVFYTTLFLKGREEMHEIDSRTSDGIALAVRFNCPIFTYEHILDTAGVEVDENDKAQITALFDTNKENDNNGLKQKSTDELHQLLDEALANEDYELAANIRDELNKRIS